MKYLALRCWLRFRYSKRSSTRVSFTKRAGGGGERWRRREPGGYRQESRQAHQVLRRNRKVCNNCRITLLYGDKIAQHPRTNSETVFLENVERVHAERCAYEKVSTRYFQRQHFRLCVPQWFGQSRLRKSSHGVCYVITRVIPYSHGGD